VAYFCSGAHSFTCAAWWTSREKLRLDLYNRRFDIYSRALDFYHALTKWTPTELEKTTTSLQDSPELEKTQRAFIKASREAQFLFDDKDGVHKRLEQMNSDSMGIIGYRRDIAPKQHTLNPSDRLPSETLFSDCLKRFFFDTLPPLEQEMSKYLDFHALSAWGWRHKKRE
jgi:hypothetical protein